MSEYTWPEMDMIADEVVHEAIRAARKYPNLDGMYLSLLQECGELATQLRAGNKRHVRAEAIQVAALALRIAVQGDNDAVAAFCPLAALDDTTPTKRSDAEGQ